MLTVYKKEIIKLLNLNTKFDYLMKDETVQHSIRCAIFASEFGVFLGLSKRELNVLIIGALLHDVGKFLLPKEILYKKGRLSDEEYEIIKTHTINIPNITNHVDIVAIIQQHHERVDGTGYPFGMVAEQIHPLAKIMSVIDVYDALPHKRSYKNAFMKENVLQIMMSESGKQFDEIILNEFLVFLEKKGL